MVATVKNWVPDSSFGIVFQLVAGNSAKQFNISGLPLGHFFFSLGFRIAAFWRPEMLVLTLHPNSDG